MALQIPAQGFADSASTMSLMVEPVSFCQRLHVSQRQRRRREDALAADRPVEPGLRRAARIESTARASRIRFDRGRPASAPATASRKWRGRSGGRNRRAPRRSVRARRFLLVVHLRAWPGRRRVGDEIVDHAERAETGHAVHRRVMHLGVDREAAVLQAFDQAILPERAERSSGMRLARDFGAQLFHRAGEGSAQWRRCQSSSGSAGVQTGWSRSSGVGFRRRV